VQRRSAQALSLVTGTLRPVEAAGINGAWPEPVTRVRTALREAGAEARLEEFPVATRTADEAARAVGCELRQIVKSLLFDCDGRAVLVLVPGDRRADALKVAALTGASRARVAGPAEVEAATGYSPGAVAPFPLRRVERVLIEKSLLGEHLLWIGAGSTRHMAGLQATELVRVARAHPVDVTEDV
jgi:prolyl-tRNA editing enzyme YbaK/EbsC (Cys-tRNA(Pro) deacylase)